MSTWPAAIHPGQPTLALAFSRLIGSPVAEFHSPDPIFGGSAAGAGRPGRERRPTKPDLARGLIDLIAERFPDREVHIVADAFYGCGAFAGLGHGMSMTTRAKRSAVFFELAPPRTGKRGRPRSNGP